MQNSECKILFCDTFIIALKYGWSFFIPQKSNLLITYAIKMRFIVCDPFNALYELLNFNFRLQ